MDDEGIGGLPRPDAVKGVLAAMQQDNPEITGCALLSDDGLMIECLLPDSLEEGFVQGMAAMLASVGERTSNEMGLGPMEQIIVRGRDGFAVMVGAAEKTYLLVITSSTAKLGLALLDATRAAAEIRKKM